MDSIPAGPAILLLESVEVPGQFPWLIIIPITIRTIAGQKLKAARSPGPTAVPASRRTKASPSTIIKRGLKPQCDVKFTKKDFYCH